MGPVFIAIADNVSARFYSQAGRGQPLKLVDQLAHPEGGMRNQDLVTDRPGRQGGAGGYGDAHDKPKEHEQQKLAHDIAQRLEKAHTAGQAEELVLVMGPRMLGSVRKGLKDTTQKKIAATIESDIAKLDDGVLAEHLKAKWFVTAGVFG